MKQKTKTNNSQQSQERAIDSGKSCEMEKRASNIGVNGELKSGSVEDYLPNSSPADKNIPNSEEKYKRVNCNKEFVKEINKQNSKEIDFENLVTNCELPEKAKSEEDLLIKIIGILAEYKFNSTQTETTEMIAERIINIIRNQTLQQVEKIAPEFIHPKLLIKFKQRLGELRK